MSLLHQLRRQHIPTPEAQVAWRIKELRRRTSAVHDLLEASASSVDTTNANAYRLACFALESSRRTIHKRYSPRTTDPCTAG